MYFYMKGSALARVNKLDLWQAHEYTAMDIVGDPYLMNILVFLYIIFIIFLHLAPLGDTELNTLAGGAFRVDYLLHILLFLPWMFPAYFRLQWPRDGRNKMRMLWRLEKRRVAWKRGLTWMVMGIGLAAGSEGMHYWLPYRSFNPIDLWCNVFGIILGTVLLGGGYAFHRHRPA